MIEGVQLTGNVLRSDIYRRVWDYLNRLVYTRIERPAMHLSRSLQNDNTNNMQAHYLIEMLKGAGIGEYIEFDDVSIVRYDAGADYVDWHSDGGPLLEPGCQMGILSFGAERVIEFRRRGEEEPLARFNLTANDLIVQRAGFQDEYQHRIPPSAVDALRFSIVLFTHSKRKSYG